MWGLFTAAKGVVCFHRFLNVSVCESLCVLYSFLFKAVSLQLFLYLVFLPGL